MLKIEAGKFYRTRDGRKVGPMVMNNLSDNLCGYGGGQSTHYVKTGRVRMDGEDDGHDLIAEWSDAPDLTAINVPFGLLDRETQEALKAHGGPYEIFNHEGCWAKYTHAGFGLQFAYRVKPAPPKPREWWLNPDGRGVVAYDEAEMPPPWVRVREILE